MHLDSTEIIARVNAVMHQGFEIPFEELKPEARLKEDLQLDSLDAVDMLVQLEESLGVKVSGERLMTIKKLGDIYFLLEELQSSSPNQTV
jgi:acyl carrier protein